GIDDVAEAVLVLIVLAADQIAFHEPAVRAGKIGDIDLHVVLVEGRQGPFGLAEDEILVLADPHAGDRAVAVQGSGGSADHLAIEGADARSSPDRNVELDVGNSEPDPAETRGVRLEDAHTVAPRAGRLDEI